MRIGQFEAAIGKRDCDFLSIGNAWLDLTITRAVDGDMTVFWTVLDDTYDTLAEALDVALGVLAQYERGRMD